MIHARALAKSYGDFQAVAGIDFEVARGESFGLLGPNGAGKSTTMRMLATTMQRSSGDLTILGMDPNEHGPQIRAHLGVVPQQDNLDGELTAEENLWSMAATSVCRDRSCVRRSTSSLSLRSCRTSAHPRSRRSVAV